MKKEMIPALYLDKSRCISVTVSARKIYSPKDLIFEFRNGRKAIRLCYEPYEYLNTLCRELDRITESDPVEEEYRGRVAVICHKAFQNDGELYDRLIAYSVMDGPKYGTFLYPVGDPSVMLEIYRIGNANYETYYKKRNVTVLYRFTLSKQLINDWAAGLKKSCSDILP